MDVHDWEEMTHQPSTTAPITQAEIRHRAQFWPGSVEVAITMGTPLKTPPIVTEARLPANDPIMCCTLGDGVDGT